MRGYGASPATEQAKCPSSAETNDSPLADGHPEELSMACRLPRGLLGFPGVPGKGRRQTRAGRNHAREQGGCGFLRKRRGTLTPA
jgi:hypothetical protein